jgi:hypothetical protein
VRAFASIIGFVASCGGGAPPVVQAIRVEPVAIAPIEDAGPKCVEPVEEPAPKWNGTYPKTLPRLTNEEWAARSKMLLERNPGVEAFLVDQYGGAINGFTIKKPYGDTGAYEPYNRFAGGRIQIPLDDVRSAIDELRCTNPDVARFDPTHAYLFRSPALAFLVELDRKPTPLEVMIRDEPLPPPLGDDVLLSKWNVTVEMGRAHQRGSLVKRVVVGKVSVAKKYLSVHVQRAAALHPTQVDLRLTAYVLVLMEDLRRDVLTPRFGATLDPEIFGNDVVFDAVTGERFNPM